MAKKNAAVNRNSQYTGFTTKCRKCKQEVNVKFVGKTKEGVAKYIISCKCEKGEL